VQEGEGGGGRGVVFKAKALNKVDAPRDRDASVGGGSSSGAVGGGGRRSATCLCIQLYFGPMCLCLAGAAGGGRQR
jgi:hypothetical protein